MPISHFTYVMQIHSTSFHFCCLLGNQSNLPFCPRQTLTCSLPMNMLGLREDGESWERHDETRETRCTAIFTCTLTKVCFLYTAREGRDGAPQKEGGQTSEPPWCELSDLWPGRQLGSIPPPSLKRMCCFTFALCSQTAPAFFNMVKCRICRNVFFRMLIKCFTHSCSLTPAVWCIHRLLQRLQVPEAADRVCRGVLPAGSWGTCSCDPYGRCQRPCQGSAPYQLACSPLRLSLPAGEEKREGRGTLFVCLLCFI